MHYGVCGEADIAGHAANAGFDFMECSVGALLKPREDEASFRAALAAFGGSPLKFTVVNCFVPADLKITGPKVDRPTLKHYVDITCARAEKAGVGTIVLGSGGARSVPEGFPAREAFDQIAEFCTMCAPLASNHGITIVVEPLNSKECNILTTVRESALLVQRVNHPSIRLLVDAYHWAMDSDSETDITTFGELLHHVHIATVPNRQAPGVEECDFSAFFRALASAKYQGRISIEGGIPDPTRDLSRALATMRKLAQ